MSGVRAILFDADGVVQHTTPAFRETLLAVYGDRPGADQFLGAIFAAERPALVGEVPFERALAPVIREYEFEDRREALLTAWRQVEPDQQALALVGALRERGYLCCLATNQQDLRRQFMSMELGYSATFDREYYSCDIGQRKPDASYFEHILADLGMAPAEVLFVDDSEANVAAAAALGMRTLHFNGGDLSQQLEAKLARAQA